MRVHSHDLVDVFPGPQSDDTDFLFLRPLQLVLQVQQYVLVRFQSDDPNRFPKSVPENTATPDPDADPVPLPRPFSSARSTHCIRPVLFSHKRNLDYRRGIRSCNNSAVKITSSSFSSTFRVSSQIRTTRPKSRPPSGPSRGLVSASR